jgi:GTP cyclohydrolase IA
MTAVDMQAVERAVTDLLKAIGEDPERPGLVDTPARVARYWREFIQYNPGNCSTTFEAVTTDQLVTVTGMRVWSLCEHHLLPFWCDVSIGYVAQDRVVGLSKLGRIAHKHAHRLQIQERLVDDIATEVQELARTNAVAVVAQGVHLCMAMRGVKTPHHMTSSAVRGAFRDNPHLRSEFFRLVSMPVAR